MADDDDAGVAARAPTPRGGEAVEVQIVGRLVEQEHVEAGEQQRGQRAARRLAARQHGRRPVEQTMGETELRPHLADPASKSAAPSDIQ